MTDTTTPDPETTPATVLLSTPGGQARLRKVAQAATEGTWYTYPTDDPKKTGGIGSDALPPSESVIEDAQADPADLAFAAMFCPAVALAALDLLDDPGRHRSPTSPVDGETEARRERLRALLPEVTEGPWEWEPGRTDEQALRPPRVYGEGWVGYPVDDATEFPIPATDADAEFVALARAEVGALLEENRALRDALSATHGERPRKDEPAQEEMFGHLG